MVGVFVVLVVIDVFVLEVGVSCLNEIPYG